MRARLGGLAIVIALAIAGWRSWPRDRPPQAPPSRPPPTVGAAGSIPRFTISPAPAPARPTPDAGLEPDARLPVERGGPTPPRWQAFLGPDWRPVDVPRDKKMDFTPAETETLARQCRLVYDVPRGLFGQPWSLAAAEATSLGLSPEEHRSVNRALAELVGATEREYRELYGEMTGDAAAAQRLARFQLEGELHFGERFLAPSLSRLLTIAWERAGKLPPPEHPETLPPRDRALRRLVSIGGEWEAILEKIVGAQRAHAVRDATTARSERNITGPPECLRWGPSRPVVPR